MLVGGESADAPPPFDGLVDPMADGFGQRIDMDGLSIQLSPAIRARGDRLHALSAAGVVDQGTGGFSVESPGVSPMHQRRQHRELLAGIIIRRE